MMLTRVLGIDVHGDTSFELWRIQREHGCVFLDLPRRWRLRYSNPRLKDELLDAEAKSGQSWSLGCRSQAQECSGSRSSFKGWEPGGESVVAESLVGVRAAQMGSYGEGSLNMDARIWGKLGNHVDLSLIYAKLPMDEFFRLRQVCKEWNRLASDRGFLEESFRDPTPTPYFVVDSAKMGHRLFSRDASTGRWRWTRLPSAKSTVAGLLCEYGEHSNNNRVFNLHTRVFHALPPPPELPDEADEFEEPLVGLTVDTSPSPYSFKVFLGEADIGTRIYDSKSNSWTQKPSTHSSSCLATDSEYQQKPYCFCSNGVLYFRVWDVNKPMVDLHSYDLEKDEWQVGEPWVPDEVWTFCDMGAWQERVFYLRMMPEGDAAIEVVEYTVGAGHETKGGWTVIDRMPDDLRTWVLAGQEDKVGEFGEEVELQGVFCGEHVLVYNCAGVEDVTERAVLYNLEGKTWEKLQLPPSWPRVVRAAKDEEEEDEEDEEDEEGDAEGDNDEEEGDGGDEEGEEG